VMEQKICFIQAYLAKRTSKSELCKQFGISRPTGDKWIQRYHLNGLAGLSALSRKPHHNPNAVSAYVCERLVQEKLKRRYWGAKKLLDHLRQLESDIKWCADSTGDRILAKAGLVETRRKHLKTPADSLPFGECHSSNHCWSMDFKGDFMVGNKRCYPFTLHDNYSRYLFACQGLTQHGYTEVQPLLERIFKEYGLPWAIRSDNGAPFASVALGGLTKLSKWLIDLGIRPERIEAGKPQQNGRLERMHRELKRYIAKVDTLKIEMHEFQQKLDIFREEFNQLRSHEGLERQMPMSCYTPSIRIYPTRIEEYEYHREAILRSVRHNGEIKWRGKLRYISEVLAGEKIAFLPKGDGLWEMFYRFHFLGELDDITQRIIRPTLWHKPEV
ncbi:transposase, partial [Pasteurellaceae bacterium Phil11]